MQMLSSQSTKINLLFCLPVVSGQWISSAERAESDWLVTRCIKSPLKYQCDSRAKFMSWLKQSGHLGGGAGQQLCHCALCLLVNISTTLHYTATGCIGPLLEKCFQNIIGSLYILQRLINQIQLSAAA